MAQVRKALKHYLYLFGNYFKNKCGGFLWQTFSFKEILAAERQS